MARAPRPAVNQMAFSFEVAAPPGDAELAGLDRVIAGKVARALKDDIRSRDVIAGAMSALLNEEVTRWMLDAYASPARDAHNIPFHRMLALISVTGRVDLLDKAMRRIGCAALFGEEMAAARLGHLEAQKRAIDEEIKRARQTARPIERGGPL